MATEKLYYLDSHIKEFDAQVLGCEKCGDSWEVILDRSAFFPGGGGQECDTGMIEAVPVLSVKERGGDIVHICAGEFAVGQSVRCTLDFETRLRRMQNHSGEHIFSGLVNSHYGYDNVGFHMGESFMTIDFSGELTWEQLTELERLANETVRANIPVNVSFPDEAVLKTLSYRSKLELTENVRIVEIPGIDCCACCAPHVYSTAEVQLVKVLDFQRHRGGVRISLVCGMDAYNDYCLRQNSVTEISRLLSAKRGDISGAVERVLDESAKKSERIAALSMELVRFRAESIPDCEGNIVIFDTLLDEVAQRELINLLSAKCTGFAAFFSGSDETGYRYVIGSRNVDLRRNSKTINSLISGRGGGTAEMIRGQAAASGNEISACLRNLNF